MPRRFKKQAVPNWQPGEGGTGWNRPEPAIRGTLEGQGGPAPSQQCPHCGNPLNPDVRCSNGYCVTNGGSGHPSHLPEPENMRTEWMPEQIRASIHNAVPCPVCGGNKRTGKAPCSKCEGKGIIEDWGASALDALESKIGSLYQDEW